MPKQQRVSLKKNEPPDQVHGRLLEAVHVAGYSFQRACDELKWLLRQGRWKAVGPGYDDIHAFISTLDFSELRPAREARQDIVRQLKAIDASQRATARLLGVSQETVARDLGLRDTNVSTIPKDIPDIQQEPTKSPDIADTNVSRAPAAPIPSSLRPYYSESGITIYHGDCREILPSIERGLMVTDPPYNVGYHYDEYNDELDEDAYWAFLSDVLQMPLVLLHYPERIFPVAQLFGRAPDRMIAWVYHANTPRQWRALAWFGLIPDLTRDFQAYRNPTDKRIQKLRARGREGARVYDWWEIEQVKNISAEKTEHPCQIPTALMKRVLQVTPFDGPIIDPFCGSGTTLVAAQALGRQAIGIDCSEEYCDAAKRRLQQPSLALVTS